jgi:hypothetical protein
MVGLNLINRFSPITMQRGEPDKHLWNIERYGEMLEPTIERGVDGRAAKRGLEST